MLPGEIEELRKKLRSRRAGLMHIEDMLGMHELLQNQPEKAFDNCSLSIELQFTGPFGDVEAVLKGGGNGGTGKVRLRPKDARMLIRCMQRITLENIAEKTGELSFDNSN